MKIIYQIIITTKKTIYLIIIIKNKVNNQMKLKVLKMMKLP